MKLGDTKCEHIKVVQLTPVGKLSRLRWALVESSGSISWILSDDMKAPSFWNFCPKCGACL